MVGSVRIQGKACHGDRFLPTHLRVYRSEARHFPHYIHARGRREILVFIERRPDNKRTIYESITCNTAYAHRGEEEKKEA